VDPEDQVITDGLIVRGIYSTITLAVYGFPVDQVPLKEPSSDVPASEPVKDDIETSLDLSKPPAEISSPTKHSGPCSDTVLVSPSESEGNRSDVLIPVPTGAALTPIQDSKKSDSGEQPRAIPTINTRVHFDSAFPGREDEVYKEEPIDRSLVESDLSSDEQFESKADSPSKPQVQPIAAALPIILPEVEDAEDISDGEVFATEEGSSSICTSPIFSFCFSFFYVTLNSIEVIKSDFPVKRNGLF